MVSTSLPKATEKNIAQLIAERAERGWDLYITRRALITHEDSDTYTVPSQSGRKTYTVRYGAGVEECSCTDYGVHEGRITCKHLVAVALLYARRRRVHSTCKVCGKSSHEKTLVGLRGDRSRHGPRWCLPHHPESVAAPALAGEGL